MEQIAQTPQQLGQILRGQRKAQHLRQASVATRVGLLIKTVSKLENDPGSSSIGSLFKLLSALNLEIVIRPKGGGEGKKSSATTTPTW